MALPVNDPCTIPDSITTEKLRGHLLNPEFRIQLAVVRALEYGKATPRQLVERANERSKWVLEAAKQLVAMGIVQVGWDGSEPDDQDYYRLSLLGWLIAGKL